ncbi:MAG TPA: peptidylprolyl isomerase [Planctomycetota bacterium]|nr:peptidylprolyl isomerase [Planctomycetota bacterium]
MRSVLGSSIVASVIAFGIFACKAVPAPPVHVDEGKAIARLEDMRTIGPNGELLAFLKHPEAEVRARAATAIGRLRVPIGGSTTTAQLGVAIDDPVESVRAAAAFALGMRGDPAASAPLIMHAVGTGADRSRLVRARLIEAASKLEEPLLLTQYLTALEDQAAEVRLEAAAGTARWKTDTALSTEINARLAEYVAKETDLDARIHGLFALERRKAKEGREVFLKRAGSSDVHERLFAVRGLATLAGDPAIDEALATASRDEDWRVAVEALRGLSKSSSNTSLEAIAAATEHANFHVRATAIESGAAQYDAFAKTDLIWKTNGVGKFDAVRNDPSPAVRAAAMANIIQVIPEPAFSEDPSPHVRAALAAQAGKISLASGTSFQLSFDDLYGEKDFLVLGAYLTRLGELDGPPPGPGEPEPWWWNGAQQLESYLAHPDNGIRLAAVSALLSGKSAGVDVEHLEKCYDGTKGEISSEVRFNLLKLAAKVGGYKAIKLLERGLADTDAFVRRTAHEELEKLTKQSLPFPDQTVPEVELAFPGQGKLEDLRPQVVIATDRGEMEFVLFADETPQHVYNFLEHIDFYKGTTFHRIVSDFVAQGGDARGDGNGGSSWRGDALRHEITPRKYVRGSLGMPRNEDWDSGGSQIFITHRMTPHLDGRYTIFGELVKGFDVLDALDLGDKIKEVRLLR